MRASIEEKETADKHEQNDGHHLHWFLYHFQHLGERIVYCSEAWQRGSGAGVWCYCPFSDHSFHYHVLGCVKEKAGKRTVISHAFILFYLFLELSLDYLLKIQFREILALHVLYNIVFYAALFSMIGVSFDRNKKMGFVVTITFLILIGCLMYYLLPF
jgi:hypothetical protein